MLDQTDNRYLNGIGSDLDRMRYLMDNAAAAQQSLGLQFGVSLTADQIAALDHSLLWWEKDAVNGETAKRRNGDGAEALPVAEGRYRQ
ncbi:hypothetical protein QY91_15330 [Enterobacter ludwigii]|nr:hypothetical protein BH714_15505 [Enterobacter ludwigii]KIF87139.1 hypothetical protein QY91_15330 [Enterobacter ludwigii]